VVALDAAAAEAGRELVLATTTPRRSVDAAVETLVDSRCDELVLLGVGTAGRLEALAAQCRTVVVGRRGTEHVPGVRADDAAGLEAAVDHLVGLGHRRIAHAEGPRGAIASARRRGYLAAMRRHGLADHCEVIAAGQDEAAGLEVGRAILGRPAGERPTAVVAFNDRCAIGIRDALVRSGLDVPGDLAIVGYDDSPPARLATVDLTSVSQDPQALAAATLAVLAGPPGAEDVVVPPRLVIRGSTAR
jgi:DNA-binding LacI/PurR family transcriptional regulator